MSSLAVLTRPEQRNVVLAARLRERGINVLSVPALRLQPLVTDAGQLPLPDGFDLLVFVSSHAAQSYLDLMEQSRSGHPWPDHVRVATVGQASAQPLYNSGLIPHNLIFHPEGGSQGQDSEGLWQVLGPVLSQIRRVLIVRGQAGREWLGTQFEQYGIGVTRLSLYQREPECWQGAQARALQDALQTPRFTVFLLTSSDSVDAVYANMQRLNLVSQWAQCRFIVIHERISDRLQTILQTSDVHVRPSIQICAPTDEAICQAIQLSVSQSGSL